VTGPGYGRKRFGCTWLLVETSSGPVVLVPAEQAKLSGERLVLPYAAGYVEAAPAVEEDRPLTRDEERRLRLHYGIGSGSPEGGCRVGCGLCMASRRTMRRSGR